MKLRVEFIVVNFMGVHLGIASATDSCRYGVLLTWIIQSAALMLSIHI